MKIWIVGAGGMLGRRLSRLCKERELDFFGTLHGDADITALECLKEIIEKEQPSHIINCAGYTQVDVAEKEQERAFAVNALGPKNLGILAREYGAKLVHVSTDYVFDGARDHLEYVETDATSPLSVYGKSKLEGEQNLLEVFPEACIVRTSWLFGEGGKNFISSLLGFLRQNEEVRVVSDQYSRATYCGDLASALLSLLEFSGVFHFANSGKVSRFDVALALYEMLRRQELPIKCQRVLPVSHTAFPLPAKRPLCSVLSTEKVEKALDLKIRSWKEALEECVTCCAVC